MYIFVHLLDQSVQIQKKNCNTILNKAKELDIPVKYISLQARPR